MSHTDARRCAHAALVAVERAARQATLARIQDRLDLGAVVPKDRGLALELALGTERMHLLLDRVLEAFVERELPREAEVLCALRLGAYQLLFLTRVPAHAAVHETVGLAGHARGFVNAVLRRVSSSIVTRAADPERITRELALSAGEDGCQRALQLPEDVLPDPAKDPDAAMALVHGLPAFLVTRWRQRWDAATAESIAKAASAQPEVFLRVRSELGAEELTEELARAGSEVVPTEDAAIVRVVGGRSPFESESFQRGDFVAQDPTALAAVRALGTQADESVLDLCAAPGTKTTFLAECVGMGGRVIAYDSDPARLRRVRENLRRLGLEQVEVHEEIPRGEAFDRVLVDAPCSNTGVLSRRVEVRRRISPESIARLSALQKGLLASACQLVKPGGHVLYSTCSLEREENESVVATALERGAVLVAERTTLPEVGRHDGGYWALLKRGMRDQPSPP